MKKLIEEFGLSPKKSYGQHFLIDNNIIRKIVAAAGDIKDKLIIEIGPGPGVLTEELLKYAAKVKAIEIDDRCLPILAKLSEKYPGRLEVINKDALQVDEEAILDNGIAKIVANLPYNVSTPLILKWLKKISHFESITIMIQKEVAMRLKATSGADYGRLSVITQTYAGVEYHFDVPPTVFYPPPKVVSAVVTLKPKASLPTANEVETIEKVTAAAFGQRRKMLRSSLKSLGVNTEKLLQNSNITPTKRAEELDLSEFHELARQYKLLKK